MERRGSVGGDEADHEQIAHQLRDLLTACKGYVDLAERALAAPAIDRERIAALTRKAATYLGELDDLITRHYGTTAAYDSPADRGESLP